MTSPDGSNWTSQTSAADNEWYGVTYGNGLFVAVASSGSGNRVMTSPDGITWTSRASAADNQWRSVTYGNGLFVAVAISGSGDRVMTSPDGINWTSRTSAADNFWFGVTYGNGLFVAVAASGSSDRVMTSSTTYSVSATVSGGNGTVSCSPPSVSPGGSSTCTATPAPGYQVKTWLGACANWGSNRGCTLSNIQYDQVSTVSFVPGDYVVSVTVVGGLHGVAGCTPPAVVAGGSSTCDTIPAVGYQVQGWTGACAAAGNSTQCALTNIQSDQTSTVSFELIPIYAITASVAGGNGSVSCTPGTVKAGGSSACTAVPNAGFQVQNWTGACASAGSNAQCALTNIQSDQASTVSFALIPAATYTVTATAADNYGTASCLPNNVKAGDNSTCYAVPLSGFRVKSWSGACAFAGSNAQCSLTNINSNQASTVSFELIPAATYSVSATVVGGNYGSVSCAPGTVQAGQDSACYAVPYAGYRVASWGGACAAAGSNAQCALTKIQADQVSTVSFELIPPATYTVSATVLGGNGGSVSCLPTSVTAGQDSTCYAVPYIGFQVQSWGGDCASAGNAAQCSLTNIQTDQVATVSFEAVPLPTYAVSATVASGNGTVDCAPSPVTKGDSSSCTAVPDPGWQVVGWSGACAASGANAHCFLPKIQQDEVSTVSFGLIPPNTYHVSASVVLGAGAVSCTPDTVTAGGQSTCTAIPDTGYQVQNWGGACALSGSNAQCYLTKIKKDQAATVSFALLPPATYTVSATVTGGNGAVSCTPGTVTAGGSSSCIAVPDAGFQVQGWTGACAAFGSNPDCALTNLQTDQSSTVSFAALPVPSYTVSATVVGGNGTVNCAPSPVPQGGSSSCTAVPALGYQVQGWTGACLATGSNVQCALTNIQSNQGSSVSFSALPANTYHVSASVVLGNGSVSCTPTSVTKGGQSTCTAVPATGWQVQNWGGACASAGANAQCFLAKIQKDQNATVSFALILPATHSVSATVAGGNGAVSCSPTTVTKNDASTCLAVPDPGYQVQSWAGACAGANSNPECYLTKVQKDAVSTVSFVALPVNHYSVVATVIGGNGTVSCTPTSVTAGQGSTCTVVPEAGYQVQSWAGACLLAGSAAQCNLTNIQNDQTSTVSFAAIPPITYTVSATVASGSGTVSCAPSPVIKGASSSCTATPAAGWQVTGWTGACAATGANVQCFLPKVQKNEVSTVSFSAIPPGTASVSARVVLGLGSVSCTPSSVSLGGSSTCLASPAAGYQVSGWGGACVAAGSSTQCRLTNLMANQAVTVSFAILLSNTVTVSATVAGGNGTVSCQPLSVPVGGGSTCTAVPNPGFQVQGWTGACAAFGMNPVCTLTNIQTNQVSTVIFSQDPQPIPTLDEWGLIILSGLLLMMGAGWRRRLAGL
ncbi:MAG: IPTL-CTERM sorting domain-containing protein [Chromatiaceae bacterium]